MNDSCDGEQSHDRASTDCHSFHSVDVRVSGGKRTEQRVLFDEAHAKVLERVFFDSVSESVCLFVVEIHVLFCLLDVYI